MENKRINSKREWVIRQVRENLKNTTGKDDMTWFDLAPYRNKAFFPDASMIESILEKADEFWGVINIVERKHSKYEETSKEHPEVNWLELKVDRDKFTSLCHDYGIKGPDEEDEEISESDGSENTRATLSESHEPQEVESITVVARNPGSRNDKLWLVFNNNFNDNIEFTIAGKRDGDSYIRVLLNLAQGYEEEFSSQTATAINSKIFDRKDIEKKYKQKTIVQKEGGKFRINKDVKISFKPMGMLNKEQLEFFPKA